MDDTAKKIQADMRGRALRAQQQANDEALTLKQMVAAWPIILRALNRRNVLTPADLNDIRFAVQRLENGGPSLRSQIERALEPKAQDIEDKKRRPDEK